MKKGTYISNFVVLVLNLVGGFRLMCYVVKSLSKIRVAGSTCTRGLYMAPTTPTSRAGEMPDYLEYRP